MTQFRNVSVLPVVALLVAIWSVDHAQAQQRGRGFGSRGYSTVQLASLKKVQDALKLSDSQKTKAAEIAEKLSSERREIFSASSDDFAAAREKVTKLTTATEGKLKNVLENEQSKRLRAIQIQVNGAATLRDEDVIKALKIADEQKSQLAKTSEANTQAMREAFQDLQGTSREERREKFTELRKKGNEKLLAVLTTDQRAAFKKLQGEKIELDLTQLRRGRRRNN
jgi:Spy/CpxP family protein refolding chaperone